MVPLHHDHEHKKEKHPKGRKHIVDSALNTQDNAMKSVVKARDCINMLNPGKVWTHRAPHGELEIKGSLNLDDIPVLVLRFHPEDGSLLPKGLHPFGEGKPEAISLAEKQLRDILAEIVVLDGAEFREPESCWALPVSHKGRIIGHIKVSSEGEKILPDKKACAEQSL